MEAGGSAGLRSRAGGKGAGGAADCGALEDQDPVVAGRGGVGGLRSRLDIQQGHPLVLVATLPAVDHLWQGRPGHSTAWREGPDWPRWKQVLASGL